MTMGTASTMALLTEVLGMQMPGTAEVPADDRVVRGVDNPEGNISIDSRLFSVRDLVLIDDIRSKAEMGVSGENKRRGEWDGTV